MCKRYLAAICALVLSSCGPLWAHAGVRDSLSLLITEVSTGTTSSASAEFVEVYNPNDIPYSLQCIDLHYASSVDEDGEPRWTSKVKDPEFTESDVLPARGFGLLATDVFLEETQEEQEEDDETDVELEESNMRTAELTQGLVDGHRSLRLVEYDVRDATEEEQTCNDETHTVHDTVGWGGDAPGFETAPFTWLNEDEEPQDDLPRDSSMK